MKYVCVKFKWSRELNLSDIILAMFSDSNIDMFEEGEQELRAFIKEDQYSKNEIIHTLSSSEILKDVNFTTEIIEHQNWNAMWESNYESILIKDEVYIRAPFHQSKPNVKHELLIQPKMSFGTGHHNTTKLMIEYLLELNISNKQVLDMGTGTGVLALLAEKLGAKHVLAIDNDKNCIVNSVENCLNNNSSKVSVLEGDIDNLGLVEYDLILANINKNVILNYLKRFSKSLKQNAILVISGFYEPDLVDIEKEANRSNLKLENYKKSNAWCSALFKK
ncbi:MAG: 50S ribosomal protein L11 methyltransferase [Bacteroidia bacterium]|nr:50S ribosomal protein L11 methyltransferase [Bacteroidia bacterium]